jgi:adenylate kinase
MNASSTAATHNALGAWLGAGSINIFGYPFAGKDTQGSLLAKALGAPLIGGGDILRNSVIPPHVKAAIDRGELAPTEEYLQIVLPYLSREEFQGKPLVLSSVGRWSGEETGVMQATSHAGHPIKAVISLNLDEREVWRRFETIEKSERHPRGYRHDDAADAIEVRLEEFRVKTLPVLDFYRSLGLVIDIDSTQPIEAVHQTILDQLHKKATIV